ncbi:MAG: hypothetical protein V4650_10265 [Pseudomonadota bacterium]
MFGIPWLLRGVDAHSAGFGGAARRASPVEYHAGRAAHRCTEIFEAFQCPFLRKAP